MEVPIKITILLFIISLGIKVARLGTDSSANARQADAKSISISIYGRAAGDDWLPLVTRNGFAFVCSVANHQLGSGVGGVIITSIIRPSGSRSTAAARDGCIGDMSLDGLMILFVFHLGESRRKNLHLTPTPTTDNAWQLIVIGMSL